MEEVETVNEVKKEDKPFTLEKLKEVWSNYAQSFKEKRSMNEFLVMEREITIDATNTIHLMLDNLIQLDQLNAFKPELLEHLRKKLENFSIKLETELAPDSGKRVLYTDKEKFQYLVEKYPILNDLRNRLGLDTDF